MLGESCDVEAKGYLVNRDETVKIPACAFHAQRAKARLNAVNYGAQMPNGPMHPRVVEARAMLNAHAMQCRTCGPLSDELLQTLASLSGPPTSEQVVDIGKRIGSRACRVGLRLYGALGRAMVALPSE